MACPSTGPCSTAIVVEDLCCFDEITEDSTIPCLSGTPVSAEVIDKSIRAAQYVVWALSGRRFGACQVTIRPCYRHDCIPEDFIYNPYISHTGGGWLPAMKDGEWFNICGCVDSCSCTMLCEIPLPYPTCEILEVKIDGIVIPLSSFKVYNWKKLVRVDGFCFPDCNDLTKSDDELGTWSVTLEYGRDWPEMGELAIAELACEFIKSCMNRPCALPTNWTSISRQGLTVTKINPFDILHRGQTGLYQVDLFLSSSNPHGLTRRPAVWSPDVGPNWNIETF